MSFADLRPSLNTSFSSDEQKRITEVYTSHGRIQKESLYAWHRAEVRHQQRSVADILAKRLVEAKLMDLSSISVVDVGCGKGRFLRSLLDWGVPPKQLHGIDLLDSRIKEAKRLCPAIDYQVGSGLELPFQDNSTSLCTAWTVLSSVIDHRVREAIAGEMLRITKAGGYLMIYDFAVSDPMNQDTVGITRKEIARLFPGLSCKTSWTTLAPPISRRLAKLSPRLMSFTEWALPFLRTHRIFWIKKDD